MTSRDATKPPSNMIAFPSLSSGLHSLPQVTNLQNVSLHPNMYAQRAAESEAKLQKALSRTPSSFTPMPPPSPYPPLSPTQQQGSSAPLMMRPKKS